jgi:hypothetical protein
LLWDPSCRHKRETSPPPPPPPPLYAAFDPAKTLSQPQKTKALFFSLQSYEVDRDKEKSREFLETSEKNAPFSKTAQPSYKRRTEETEKCRARYVQRHNGKKKTKRDGSWEAQTLKHQQNPSG